MAEKGSLLQSIQVCADGEGGSFLVVQGEDWARTTWREEMRKAGCAWSGRRPYNDPDVID